MCSRPADEAFTDQPIDQWTDRHTHIKTLGSWLLSGSDLLTPIHPSLKSKLTCRRTNMGKWIPCRSEVAFSGMASISMKPDSVEPWNCWAAPGRKNVIGGDLNCRITGSNVDNNNNNSGDDGAIQVSVISYPLKTCSFVGCWSRFCRLHRDSIDEKATSSRCWSSYNLVIRRIIDVYVPWIHSRFCAESSHASSCPCLSKTWRHPAKQPWIGRRWLTWAVIL